ncbi:MAG TPA: TonB family protein [Micropepsaceae bacterium]|nr:TonB family protein [Micropepsaceae bacterium]
MLRRLHRELLLSALLTLGAGPCAIAGPMEDGQAAYDSEDYAAARRLWQPLAEQGIARAQNNLGVLYENGKGVPQNITEALKWYRLAAGQGYAGAENNLGLIYALGKAVPRDPIRAYMWLDLAAASLSGDLGKTVMESRDVVASSMTPQQIAGAAEMARKCRAADYKDCESIGDAEALASLTRPKPQDGAQATFDLSSPPPGSTFAIATTSHAVTPSDYPSQSIRLHENGDVTVTYVVNEMGSVASCSVLVSSGFMRLDESACAMVKKRWKYKPATEDGKPVSIQYISKVSFPPR